MIHHLKAYPEYFQPVKRGEKTFEIRKDDRNFAAGDTLHLYEWNPDTKEYTEDELIRDVPYILRGAPFLPEGYCCMSLKERAV